MPDETDRVAAAILEEWAALGIEEHDGDLHKPATIKRRTKDGGISGVPVMLRPVSNLQRVKARTRSREWARKLDLELDRDKDLVDELENYSLLAFAIRDPGDFTQHVPDGETLFREYDNRSLGQIWGEYDAWLRMLEPSFGHWDGEKLWRVVARVRAEADLTPLAAMPGIEQANCLLLMARAACDSPSAPSWLRSSETSTPVY
jgi:hypothetical protein